MTTPTRILITGAGGFLGRHLVPALQSAGFEVTALHHSDLDICSATDVAHTIAAARPDVVVHCAALSSTAYCAAHPDESEAVNVGGSVNVARACAQCEARLVYCSSDQVYSSMPDGPLAEHIPLTPNNVYGRHKLLAEKLVSEQLRSSVGLRLTWMFDADEPAHRDVANVLRDTLTTRTPLKASTREFRGITSVVSVVQGIVSLIHLLPTIDGGVFNFGSPNSLTTYDLYRTVITNMSDGTTPPSSEQAALIIPDDTWGRHLAMDTTAIERLGITFHDTLHELTVHLADRRDIDD